MVLLIIAVLTFIYFVYNAGELWFFSWAIKFIESIKIKKQPHSLPKISIIVPACNEEKHLLTAINTLQEIDYPAKEIILINDRSTDKTSAIINQIAKENSNVKTIHIETLPPCWMGKNYALSQGAKQATGEWLLFTDADVYFNRNTLKHAMSYVLEKKLDHLAILPAVVKASVWFNSMMVLLTSLYFFMAKPWRARYSWSKNSVGQGSFNLIRSHVYKQIDGHNKIALNSDDDVKLGQLVKAHGYQQDMLYSKDFIKVAWYHSLPEMLKGLEKSIFAFFNYSVLTMLLFTMFTIVLFYLPLLGVIFTSGVSFIVNLMIVLMTLAIFISIAIKHNYSIYYCFFYPLTLAIDYFMSWRAVYRTLKNQGVYWRDTFYPLAKIRGKHLKTKF